MIETQLVREILQRWFASVTHGEPPRPLVSSWVAHAFALAAATYLLDALDEAGYMVAPKGRP